MNRNFRMPFLSLAHKLVRIKILHDFPCQSAFALSQKKIYDLQK